MAGLERSSLTFRRSGSSGLVWDERLMSGDHSQMETEFKELRHSRSAGSVGLQRRRGGGGGLEHGSQAYRARRVTPVLDPPSPKVPGCIFCGIFRKAGPSKARRY